MKWLRLILSLLFLIINYYFLIPFSFATYDPLSVPNNRFGIHILFPEEINEAARLVNSNSGDWGYVTIPIQSVDRNLEKWQNFFDECRKLHIIPIIRLATYPEGPIWPKPTKFDALDWANFLNSLSWPIKNRYVIVYNEPNRSQEWGGEVNPSEYAEVLVDTYDALKRASEDFFILNAGFDTAAPTNHELMDEYQYLWGMYDKNPEVFKKIDGWASHSYPNPGFSSSPYDYSRIGIRGYQYELSFLQNNFGVYGLKVFITETGWQRGNLSEEKISEYYKIAFNEIWSDDYLVTITPFLFSASGQFENFSWWSPEKGETKIYKSVSLIKKNAGKPIITEFLENRRLRKQIKESQEIPGKEFFFNLKFKSWPKIFQWLLRE